MNETAKYALMFTALTAVNILIQVAIYKATHSIPAAILIDLPISVLLAHAFGKTTYKKH